MEKTRLTSERKLVQSIIDKKGYCYHINCSGGVDNPPNRTTLKEKDKEIPEGNDSYTNLGIVCPLREECRKIKEVEEDSFYLKMAKKWMKEYKRNLKKRKEKDEG